MNLRGGVRRIRSAFSRVVFVAAALAVALGLTSSTASMAARGAQPEDNGIAPSAMAQIQALLEEKETRTPAERKIDSQLLYARRMALGVPIAPGVQTLEVDVPRAGDGHVIVDVKANITGRLMLQLNGLSGEIKKTGDTDLRLHVDLDQIEAIAEQPDVLFVQPQQRAMTSQMDAAVPGGRVPDRAARRAATLASLRQALAPRRPAGFAGASGLQVDLPPATNAIGTGLGFASSQGDMAHRTAIYRGLTGATGAGVKIGVLSDGVANLAQAQATGDLGAVTVLTGQTGTGNEGTAMLEIIHDLAPGAQLFFATGNTSLPSFANNIRALRTAGCDIIVDDILYFVESPFQDGQTAAVVSPNNAGAVTQAVKDVAAAGALYFSAAGNSGNLNDGQSGVWEGNFAAGAATAAPVPIGGTLHRFTGTQDFDTVIDASAFPTNLFWSDPLGASANDYDLFRLNSTGTSVSSSSTNIQDGNDDPFEQVTNNVDNARIVIVKKTGAASRFLHLNTNRGRLSVGTAGQVHGHPATNNDFTFAVAASSASAVFPNTFSASSVVETFSSDGPRRFFFRGDGSVITPGNLSATGGAVLSKPDFTAADAVAVSGAGQFFTPFFGTSAAAPHAAAIAALVKSANPGFTQAQMRSALFALALDIEAPGVDRDSGAGILMAVPAQPLCTFTPVVPSQTFGPGPAMSSIGINASSSGCNWVVFSNVPWINVTTAAGTGTSTAVVSTPANRGPSRTGTVTIQGGQIVTITQLGTPATPFNSPAGTTPIPDESSVDAPLTVSGLTQPIVNLSVSLFLNHSFDGDLAISLIAPDGTIAKLTTHRGGAANNYGSACSPLTSRTTFDDNSATAIQHAAGPFVGVFRPEESLSRFLGKSGAAANGTWKLRISDDANQDTGALQCWSLHINQGPLRGVANDFDGNGTADLAVFRPASGQWFINGGTSTQFGLTDDIPVPGDYDGDGVASLAVYRPSTGQWFVGGSHTTIQWGRTGDIPVPADYNGDQATDTAVYRTTDGGTGVWLLNLPGGPVVVPWGMRGDVPMPGDYDGDGRADLAVYRPSSGQWFIAFAAVDFTTSSVATWGVPGDVPIRADVDDDQKLDFVVFRPSTGTWFMSPTNSAPSSFQFGLPGDVPVALDTNGDGFAELCVWRPSTGTWFIRNRVASTTSTVPFGAIGDIPVGQRPRPASVPVSDFDGDGVSDITVFRPSTGTWFTRFSSTGFVTNASTQLGLNGDVTVNGDYDGDRRSDQAVYRPSTGEWFILQSSNGIVRTASWGIAGDVAMPADYDGDGRIDLAVFRPSSATWFIVYSSNNAGAVFQWGLSTDQPFAQDFDGDGRADLAVYRASSGQWFLLLSTTAFGQTIVRPWGLAGDVPMPADFDGDGRSEIAVFRPSTAEWIGIDALNGGLVINRQWGLPGDIPVPHDYDGDGLIDPAVFRGNGNWFIRQSSNGALLNVQWGLSSDQPR
jgi:subtilisin-like proprotein convertase family protein